MARLCHKIYPDLPIDVGSLMSSEVLLIGGTGFAGQAILPHLLARYDVVHLIARNTDSLTKAKNLFSYCTSLDNADILNSLIPRCKDILYFASDSTPGKTAGDPLLEINTNLLPLLKFIDVVQKYEGVNIVYLSSGGTIYGNTDNGNLTEDHPFFPRSYYAAGKVGAESFLQAYSRQFHRPLVILRPANFYGIGQPYRKNFGIVRTIFERVLNDEPVEIWGDGEIIRDYINISDFVSACLIILKQQPVKDVQLFNVGSGTGVSINQLCAQIESTVGKQLNRIYKPIRSVDVKKIVLDSSKLHALGWTTDVTLKAGLSSMWEWLCAQKS